MAIIENRTTAEGDVLIIKPEVPIVGLVSLYNFVDTTVNESATDYYLKEFRYSVNGGLTFTMWDNLNIINIQNVDISKENNFVIEYRYTHVGTSAGVELEFDDILVSGNTEDLPYPIYESVFFKNFFEVNDINVYGWALNVLEKLYLHGILPEYIERGKETADPLEDQDFLVFWHTTTHLFAILVYFARQFRDISSNQRLLEKFLQVRGVEIGEVGVDDLLQIFSEYITQISLRGTESIIERKSDGADVDGELLRLINYSSPEELIFALLRSCEMGWCVGKSSPVWNGTENIINIIKGYEYTKEVTDLTKYPLSGESYITLSNGEMIIAGIPGGSYAGIDRAVDVDKRFEVNENLDYEISFFCELTDAGTGLSFGLAGYDVDGNSVNFQDAFDGEINNNFFINKVLPLVGNKYWIRGIVYNKSNSTGVTNDNEQKQNNTMQFPEGSYLRFNDTVEIKYLAVHIVLDNSSLVTPNGLKLSNIKVRPLKTPMTRGQLGVKNIILAYLKNNNNSYNLDKIEDIIKNSLISAKSFLKIKYL